MVMGPLYHEEEMSTEIEKPTKKLGPLDEKTKNLILNKFKEFYN